MIDNVYPTIFPRRPSLMLITISNLFLLFSFLAAHYSYQAFFPMKSAKASPTVQTGTRSSAAPNATNTSAISYTGSLFRKWSASTCMPRFGAPKPQSAYTQSEEDLVAMQLPKLHRNKPPSFDALHRTSCQAVCQSPLDKRYKAKKGKKRRTSVDPRAGDKVANPRLLFSSVSTRKVDLKGLKSSPPEVATFDREKMVSKE